MSNIYEINEIALVELLNNVYEMKESGHRLVQISCTGLKDSYEINYSFGKEYDFKNLRIIIKGDEELPSISSIYSPAFLYENEIKDLFGIKFKYISMDYDGKLYTLAVKTPYANTQKEEE